MVGLLSSLVPSSLKRVIHRGRLFLRARLRDLADLRARVKPEPIIILGHQKCGTSVVAALLGEISGRSVAIDLMREVDRPTFQLVESGALSIDDFIRRNRLEFSRDIVKEANLTPMYPALKQRFPGARFVFVIRDPRDNIRSILQRLGIPGRPGAAQMPAVSEAWRLVLEGAWLGLEGRDYVEMLAARWQRFAAIAEAIGPELVVLRYEDFRADKVGAIRDLAAKLDLPADRDISERIDVQYQPRGDHRETWEDYFGAEHLAGIESICAPGMRLFGYQASDELGS